MSNKSNETLAEKITDYIVDNPDTWNTPDLANLIAMHRAPDKELVKAIEALQEIQHGFVDGSIVFAEKRRSDSDPYHKANMLMTAALARHVEYQAALSDARFDIAADEATQETPLGILLDDNPIDE